VPWSKPWYGSSSNSTSGFASRVSERLSFCLVPPDKAFAERVVARVEPEFAEDVVAAAQRRRPVEAGRASEEDDVLACAEEVEEGGSCGQ
jgi:hypothetical protein